MTSDWQEKLRAMRGDLPGADAAPEAEPEPQETSTIEPRKHPRLDISIERKGRAGKTATLITGWQLADDEVSAVASTLKKRLGVGGSARGGDILLQGDYRRQAADLLSALGYRNRII